VLLVIALAVLVLGLTAAAGGLGFVLSEGSRDPFYGPLSEHASDRQPARGRALASGGVG
jgi:hypothetical protein